MVIMHNYYIAGIPLRLRMHSLFTDYSALSFTQQELCSFSPHKCKYLNLWCGLRSAIDYVSAVAYCPSQLPWTLVVVLGECVACRLAEHHSACTRPTDAISEGSVPSQPHLISNIT